MISSNVHFKTCAGMVCMGAECTTEDQNLRQMNRFNMVLNLSFHFGRFITLVTLPNGLPCFEAHGF